MKHLNQPADLANGNRKVCLAIGMFDGVHLGHQQVLRQAIEDCHHQEMLSVAVTFDRHPATVIAPNYAPALLQTRAQRLRTIESLGLDAALVIQFDEAFHRKPGEAFIRELATGFSAIHSICVGANFAFGHRRDGNVELLRALGQALGFHVHSLQAVALDGQAVSSTRIRTAVRDGQLDAAGQMLGRTFAIEGDVVRGDGRGRELGFPTANLDTRGLVLPPTGVYTAHARIGQTTHRAVLNIGFRPTVAEPDATPQVEAHLIDFDNDLYSQRIELELVDRLRNEQRFGSVDELALQITRDIENARTLF
ncbi:MAG: bifunctional riboflavin kinase/FAD synthetase [Verrucomicrobiota bacterium]|jgi:riboflavin kinase/FMN adenylyltransferase|nr:bifunctional riboflavin kinase/FAD synthetase [Verrucomicrobiota bacterium]MDP7048310.1 bifunctional riboflavin kinase/FAD synthetase [Verrucomicrobiota bacterium]